MRTVPSNSSISYSAYCAEYFSRGRQQERLTVFYGDEKETSNTANNRQNPSSAEKIYIQNGHIYVGNIHVDQATSLSIVADW
jgi:hypothetical protein